MRHFAGYLLANQCISGLNIVGVFMRYLPIIAILLVLTFFIYVYPVMALAHLLIGTAIFTPSGYVASLIIAMMVFYYMRSHSTAPLLSGFTHYGMGIGFIGFSILSIALLIAAFVPHLSQEIGLISLIMVIGTSLYAIGAGRMIAMVELSFASAKITKPTSFVFISDVHLGSNPRQHLEKIVQMIGKLDYDFLIIGGDLFDSSAFQHTQLTPLQDIEKPIYFVTGNHEFYVRDHEQKIAGLSHHKITILDNKAASVAGLNMVGIGDNQTAKLQAEIAQKLVVEDAFNLVLVHQPGIWGRLPKQADLMLSGHTHNGQIFPFNWLVRLQFKAVYGLYHNGSQSIYVSSGSGTWGPRLRLGTQNEIVHISLSGLSS